MILFAAGDGANEAAEVVEAALRRSFSARQILRVGEGELPAAADDICAVALNPGRRTGEWLAQLATGRSKILLLGRLESGIARLLGVDPDGQIPAAADWHGCQAASPHVMAESSGRIDYASTGFGALSPIPRRHLQRFDFGDEWNNLGYGRVALDGGSWSLCHAASLDGAAPVAELTAAGLPIRIVYAAIRDLATTSLLWFNRQVGPVDSQEWRLVEIFFSDYRAEALPCRPHLREIPLGHRAALTMRLDCDEDIASARPLFEMYRARHLPFSVAVKTSLPQSDADAALLRDVIAAGGSALSHSHSHPSQWGGSEPAAVDEAERSKAQLEALLPGHPIHYAVSPFHQTPPFALSALRRAGYGGVIGGSIAAEPQHLLGRGGQLPSFDAPFVSHSQQCMLHGDCLLAEGDALRVYKEAFRIALRGQSIFAYLDHPFAARYSYGWASEARRSGVHGDLLAFFAAEAAAGDSASEPLLFMSEGDCLDFIAMKSRSEIVWAADGRQFALDGPQNGPFALAIGYRGRWWPADRPLPR